MNVRSGSRSMRPTNKVIWMGEECQRVSRWGGYAVGFGAIAGGLLAIQYGSGQCISLVYDPLCPLKFYGPLWGGIAAIVAGGVWLGIMGVRGWLGARA